MPGGLRLAMMTTQIDRPYRAQTPFLTASWPVLFLDNHLLAVYKPAGLLIQADATGDPSLLELAGAWLKMRFHKPGRVFVGLVHRLDRPVAGVVLLARTSKAAARLSAQFRSGGTIKEYLAVVEGLVDPGQGRLVHHLERHGPTSRLVSRPTDDSREVSLSYRVLESRQSRTLVEIRLETGRHHQIRAQMAAIGHPVAGDLRYGAPAPLAHRQIALFAHRLVVDHPTLKHPVPLECPLPSGWPWPGRDRPSLGPPWHWRDLRQAVDRASPEKASKS